jgi:large-conductance mechanosensitive channel
MAHKQSTAKKTHKPRVQAHEHERQKEEIKTKLRNLPQRAKEEILEEVMTGQVITKQFGSFTDFLREQSVVGIGIGLVFGTQTKTVVDSVMKSFVNPITTLFLPGQQALADRAFNVSFRGRHAEIGWGAIVYNIFSFVMVALVVYLIYRLLHLEKLAKKKDA